MNEFFKAISDFFKSLLDFFKDPQTQKVDPVATVPSTPEKPITTTPPGNNIVQYYVSGTVRRNMEGPDVTTVQTVLEEKGYDVGEIDGIFQGRTEAAAIAFQKDNGLVPDGIVGARTLAKLGILIRVTTPNLPPENLNAWKDIKEGTMEFYTEILKPGVLKYDAGFETTINNVAKRVMKEVNYSKGMRELGFPDFASDGTPAYAFAGLIHNLEASGNFTKNFVNGQPINQVTTIVPKGMGPWPNWMAAFKAGMAYKGITPAKYPDLTGPQMLYLAERFNGLGYLNKPQWSPYIGAQSNISLDKGKYTSDGVYSATANANGQTGFATALVEIRRLLKLQSTPIVDVLPEFQTMFDRIMEKNPNINPQMVKQALPWLKSPLIKNKTRMMLINFDINEKFSRNYLIELDPSILGTSTNTKVAQGTKSDPDKDGYATLFSNVVGSNRSSLGAKVIGSLYNSSKFKIARRTYGLEVGLNDNDFKRAIVWHSSLYVNDIEGQAIGDSEGCYAQSEPTAGRLKDKLQDILLYTYSEQISGRRVAQEEIEIPV